MVILWIRTRTRNVVKRRIESKGRRGRQNRNHSFMEDRREIMDQRRAEERAKIRKGLLNRIIPRIERYSKLSRIGVVVARDGKVDEYPHNFWTLSGRVTGYVNNGLLRRQFTYDWDEVDDRTLEYLAKIKKFDPVEPKDCMTIIAEAAVGLHPSL